MSETSQLPETQSKWVRFLRSTEKYTKTDMVYLVQNSGWLFLGQLMASFTAFILLLLIANTLTQADYGLYRYIISLAVLLSIFSLPGISTALTQSTAQGYSGQLVSSVLARKIWALQGSFVSLLICLYYFFKGNLELSSGFFLVALLLPFFNTYFNYFYFLQGKGDFKLSSKLQVVSQLVLLLIVVVTILIYPSPLSLVAAFIFGTFLMHYFAYQITLKKYPETTNTDPELLPYGKYLTLYTILPGTIANQIGILATWYFLGAAEAAVYAIAIMLPIEVGRFATILSQVALPKMSAQTIRLTALLIKITKFSALLALLWLLYAVSAEYIFAFLLPTYKDAVGYSIFAMASIIFIPRTILQALLTANKMKLDLQRISLLTMFLQIVLTLSLIPLYGISGAIYTLLLTSLFEFLTLVAVVYRKAYGQ